MAWIYDGDDLSFMDENIRNREGNGNEIDALIDRLMVVENDMSDVSRRIGIYGKLEKAVYEYTVTKMEKGGGSR